MSGYGEAVSAVLRSKADGAYLTFWCPGCDEAHGIPVARGEKTERNWHWNGSFDAPTFQPSILIRTGHHVPNHDGRGCWCSYNAEQTAKGEEPSGFTCQVCHSHVTDGRIQFLNDCTHSLAGQTVDLPEFPR